MSTKSTTPEIEKLKLASLIIDNKYSGRSEKEITENAKEKAKELAAFGGWNPAMPGQYFERDGQKHLLAGFSRVKASLMNGDETGYFVKVEGDEISYLLACETTNSTRALSPLSRGARYSELREGRVADDFAGAIADPKNPADWKIQPMTLGQIAERVGKTAAWVGRCITIFEAPPEIRDMIETDKIAAVVADEARKFCDKHYEGNEVKEVAMCRAAFRNARAEDKDTATKQHFEAIKGEFTPVKKMVADGKEKKDKEPDWDKVDKALSGGSSSPASESKHENKGNGAETLPESDKDEPELFANAVDMLTPGDKLNAKLLGALATFLTDDDALAKLDISMTLNPDEAERLAEEIVKIVANAAEVF